MLLVGIKCRSQVQGSHNRRVPNRLGILDKRFSLHETYQNSQSPVGCRQMNWVIHQVDTLIELVFGWRVDEGDVKRVRRV